MCYLSQAAQVGGPDSPLVNLRLIFNCLGKISRKDTANSHQIFVRHPFRSDSFDRRDLGRPRSLRPVAGKAAGAKGHVRHRTRQ